MANLTWDQIRDAVGTPIILLTFWNPRTKKVVEVTIEQLSPTIQATILTFINNHIQ